MKAVFLDAATIGEANFQPLYDVIPDIEFHDTTKAEQVLERIHNKDIAILNKVKLTADILAQSKLKLICITATGTDNVDLDYAHRHGIKVRNVVDYSTKSVVQMTWTLILALQSRLLEYSQFTRSGGWQTSPTFAIHNYPFDELTGKTLGIIGYGSIGQSVAKIADQFGMKIVIANRKNAPLQSGRTPLEDVFREANIITLHCPLTKETKHLINAKTLALMKPSTIIINAARGDIVNSKDLAQALKNNQIAAAGIDVLPQEPPVDGNPLLDLDHPRLIITPHIAWASNEARQRDVDLTAQNIRDFLETM